MEHKYLFVAINAALKAGEKILSIYNDPASDFEVERKADHSPLTIADREAHEIILNFLNELPFPVLSEEGKALEYAIRKQWKTLWIVDPLDGTKEFIKKNGEFTVNIALIHEHVPVLGVIYVPVKRELYFAASEVGAYKISDIDCLKSDLTLSNLVAKAVRIPVAEVRDSYLVVASRSHLTKETEEYIRNIEQQHDNVALISSGSSIKICLVAEGKADIYPRFAPTMEWDTAAGHAIAKEAGMEIYQVGKNIPLMYNKEELLNPWFVVEEKRNSH